MAERSSAHGGRAARTLQLCARLAAVVLAMACRDAGAHASSLRVERARANVFPNGSGAAYLAIFNPGPAADRLEAAEAPWASHIELHETVHDGDVVGMREAQSGLPIPPDSTLLFEPGGSHLMLEGVKLAAGVRMASLSLRFRRAGTLRTELRIESDNF